ncbi:WD40 repeat domain-containing protein, partial [bacterium]
MSRIGAAFVISILPAAAFCQNDGLSFLTKSAPGVSSSQGSWLYGMDARRRTALIYSDSPELWTSPTYGRQYYLRSFDGLPLERIPIERLAAFPDFLTWPNVTDIRISGDGSAVMIGIRQTGLSERRYVYDRAARVFRPIVLPFSFYPLQVLKGTKVIGRKSGQTISVDLVSGVQQTLAESPYDLASPDGKYLYMRPQPPRSGETAGTASLYNVATGRIRNYRLNGMSPYGTGWFSQDYRFILYFRPGPSQPNLVRLDTLNLAESVFPAPATQGSVLDVFGDKAIFLNASEDSAKIWDLKSGALQPLATLSGNSYPTIRFVTAATVLLSTASPMQDGDRNREYDVWLGTAAAGSWRTAIPPRIGSREAAQAVIAADNAFAVTEYAAMGNEAGGKAYGFVRKDMATGTVKSLPGRTIFAGLLQVADGGKKALVQESTTRKLFHRNLDTGGETEIGLDGRDFVTAALAPSGDEAFVFAAKDGSRRLFRWTPTGSQDIPLPSGTTRVGHIAFGGGLLALATDFMAYVGPTDGSTWKALPLPSGTATVQKTAIPRDGLTVVATFQSPDSAFGFTRVYRASDAKTLKTYAGSELSSDGRWALRLR